jgi:hypothetical protein
MFDKPHVLAYLAMTFKRPVVNMLRRPKPTRGCSAEKEEKEEEEEEVVNMLLKLKNKKKKTKPT